ncbi:flagellar brake domain-containing protein [Clostridium sp. MB40-C1]|uniref:flagellar brake protein n=1 Tax=Clostridium sp. MB40-C1 TaxID=3070996 RepID=UPI0027E0B7E5|nr:flagellar brake domain-containing protein [Clostridium sp. MB40-C1]WMJ81351.1 flagellar brake domain-containing protein [Clostridium sp. MB40-C1]
MEGINFNINSKVEVIYNDEAYLCDIQDTKDNCIAISIPMKEREYLPLNKGERIDVYYYDDKCIYEFTTTVVGRERKNIPLVWILSPERYKKIQRRKFVRISLLLDVKYAVVKEGVSLSKDYLSELKFSKAIALDLSGGGMKLKTKEELKAGEHLIIAISLDGKGMMVRGKVIRASKDDLKENINGVKFEQMSLREQDRIIQYVFKIMREQMKKGLKEE